MTKFTVDSKGWRPDPENAHLQHATVEVTALVSDDGSRWENAAYRVSANGSRRKLFRGESAWSDAARLAHDIETKARFGR